MSKKSQAALEFLTTYAWAFVVVILVISAFVYFGVISPSKLFPERCSISSEIGCIGAKLGKTDVGTGVLRLKLKNNLAEPIVTTLFGTSSDSATPFACTQTPVTGIWLSDEVRDFEFTGCNNNEAGLVLGQKSKVYVRMGYYPVKAGSGYPKSVEGEIFATVSTLESVLTQVNCSDSLDNDKNGCIDYSGGDTGCSSPSDTTESGGTCPNAGGGGQPLYCFVSTLCTDTAVFRMSDLKDAHAEIPILSDYDYKVCCRAINDTLTNSCASPNVIPLHLSASTDAHVEKNTQANYATNVCLSANAKTVSCSYTTSNCLADETCLATISADTDAHVADCVTQPFANKICCKLT